MNGNSKQILTSDQHVKVLPQTVRTITSNIAISAINITTTITIKFRYDKEVRDVLRDTLHLGDRYTHI